MDINEAKEILATSGHTNLSDELSSCDVFQIGKIGQGYKQTFTGIFAEASLIFIELPQMGFTIIDINFPQNSVVEIVFTSYIKKRTLLPITVTIILGTPGQLFKQTIPVGTIGFVSQKTKESIIGEIEEDPTEYMLDLEIET